MAESKHDKFIRVAEARTNKIIDMIRLLSNCSNTATYEYTDEDVKKIFSALESELKTCKRGIPSASINNPIVTIGFGRFSLLLP